MEGNLNNNKLNFKSGKQTGNNLLINLLAVLVLLLIHIPGLNEPSIIYGTHKNQVDRPGSLSNKTVVNEDNASMLILKPGEMEYLRSGSVTTRNTDFSRNGFSENGGEVLSHTMDTVYNKEVRVANRSSFCLYDLTIGIKN